MSTIRPSLGAGQHRGDGSATWGGALGLGLQGPRPTCTGSTAAQEDHGLDILDVSRPDVPTRIARAPRWLPETVAQWRYWMTVGLGLTCLLLLAIGAPWSCCGSCAPPEVPSPWQSCSTPCLATVLVGGALIRGVRLGARSLAAGDSLARLAPIALMVGALVLAVFLLAAGGSATGGVRNSWPTLAGGNHQPVHSRDRRSPPSPVLPEPSDAAVPLWRGALGFGKAGILATGRRRPSCNWSPGPAPGSAGRGSAGPLPQNRLRRAAPPARVHSPRRGLQPLVAVPRREEAGGGLYAGRPCVRLGG